MTDDVNLESVISFQADPTMRIITTLADERWDSRTAEGIASETLLDPAEVHHVLGALTLLGVTRYPLDYSGEGQKLYRLKSRGYDWKEIYNCFRNHVGTW